MKQHTIHLYPSGQAEAKLEFDRILGHALELCASAIGREVLERAKPLSELASIDKDLRITEELKWAIELEGALPAIDYPDIREAINYLQLEGSAWTLSQANDAMVLLIALREVLGYLRKKGEKYPLLYQLGNSIVFEIKLLESFSQIIGNDGEIRPGASAELDSIRRKIRQLEKDLDKAFSRIHSAAASDGILEGGGESFLNGRRVLTVLAEYKRRIKGVVHDESSTGKTIYIEPETCIEIGNEIVALKAEERREIYRLLKALTDNVRPYANQLTVYQHFLADLDAHYGKARLAISLGAHRPILSASPKILLQKARHPLLILKYRGTGKQVIPMDLSLDAQTRVMVISGPNAGGKSVALKTVGLLQIMVQSGFLIPCGPQTELGIFRQIFIELGDEQSIDNELSTYSSKLKHLKFFIDKSDADTLFLIDEFGSGTDPQVGGAIAEAVLEELVKRGGYGVVTTHYPNIKVFSSQAHFVGNGSMAYNAEKMEPLYQFVQGQPGSSYALEIAKKTGFSKQLLQAAAGKVESGYLKAETMLSGLQAEKYVSGLQGKMLGERLTELQTLIGTYSRLKQDLEDRRTQVLRDAKEKELEELQRTKGQFKELLKDFREKQSRESAEELKAKLDAQQAKVSAQLVEIKQAKKKKAVEEEGQLKVGAMVMLDEGGQVGLIESMRNGKAVVSFENVRTVVPITELMPAKKTKAVREARNGNAALMQSAALSFNPDINVHAYRLDEALKVVEGHLDKAILLGYPAIRVLHGKGNGVLRQSIRAMLSKYDAVKSISDSPMASGGVGVTVISLA